MKFYLIQLLTPNIEYYRKYEPKIKIGRLTLSVINVCNANCTFCAYQYTKGEKVSVMSFNTFKKALDDYTSMGGSVVSFTPLIGEPLLDKGIIDKINYAMKTKKLKLVFIDTNGIALAKNNLYKKLIDSGIHLIQLSNPGFNKKAYEEVYGVKCYKEFLEGTHKLLRYNKEQGNKVRVQLNFRSPLSPSKILTSPDYVKFIKPYVKKNVLHQYPAYYDNWGGLVKKKDMRGVMKLRKVPKLKLFPCIMTFDAAILGNGDVRLCICRRLLKASDGLVIGNIKDSSLKELFYSKKSRELRRNFPKQKLRGVCRDCSFYSPITRKWLKERLKNKTLFGYESWIDRG